MDMSHDSSCIAKLLHLTFKKKVFTECQLCTGDSTGNNEGDGPCHGAYIPVGEADNK